MLGENCAEPRLTVLCDSDFGDVCTTVVAGLQRSPIFVVSLLVGRHFDQVAFLLCVADLHSPVACSAGVLSF